MVKIRTLVPLTHPTTGEQFGPDTEVDVADDVAAGWRTMGKITLISDEERNAQAAAEGHYGDVTGRQDVGQLDPAAPTGGPQEDEPPPKKGKR
jgi:hypothetical protein